MTTGQISVDREDLLNLLACTGYNIRPASDRGALLAGLSLTDFQMVDVADRLRAALQQPAAPKF